MGLFEKRRFRNFLLWVQGLDEKDPKTYQGKDPRGPVSEVYKQFGLDKNTVDFTGHAMALYLNDE